jgi:hypothetical protein
MTGKEENSSRNKQTTFQDFEYEFLVKAMWLLHRREGVVDDLPSFQGLALL